MTETKNQKEMGKGGANGPITKEMGKGGANGPITKEMGKENADKSAESAED
jgi:hypothetical protein